MDEGDIGAVDDSHALVVLPLENNVADEGPRNELLQMQRIRELDMEPLEEEADSEAGHSLSYNDSRWTRGWRRWSNGWIYFRHQLGFHAHLFRRGR